MGEQVDRLREALREECRNAWLTGYERGQHDAAVDEGYLLETSELPATFDEYWIRNYE
jgi:hypothetical protein